MTLYDKLIKALAADGWVESGLTERWAGYWQPETKDTEMSGVSIWVPIQKDAPDFVQCLVSAIDTFEQISGSQILPRYRFGEATKTVSECAEFLGIPVKEFLEAGYPEITLHRTIEQKEKPGKPIYEVDEKRNILTLGTK